MQRPRAPALAAALAVLASAANAGEQAAQEPAAADPLAQEQLLLVAVELGELTLTESLRVYGDPEDPLVPLGELGRLLDLDLVIAPTSLSGRIGETPRVLELNLKSGKGRLNGRELRIPIEDIAVTDGEAFVRASRLDELLPLDAKADGEPSRLSSPRGRPFPFRPG